MATSRSTGPNTIAAFAGAVVIGGGNFVAVKFSNEELAPFFGAALRFSGAAALFFAIAWVRGVPFPPRRAAWGAITYGLLGFGLAYALLYYALVGLSAGLTSVVMASVPLLTLALAVGHGQERFTGRAVVGGVLAILGVGVLSARTLAGDVAPIYLVAAVLAAAAAAESSVVAKGIPRLDPIMTNGIGMVAGAVMLWMTSLAFQESWTLPATARTWLVLGYLVVIGSVSLFILFLYVIERWTASATVYALALMPVVAVAFGALLAQEPITWELVIGAVLVISAVGVGAPSREQEGTAPDAVPRA